MTEQKELQKPDFPFQNHMNRLVPDMMELLATSTWVAGHWDT